MNHFNILQRAFRVTINYRVLWVFGILLALTTGGGSSGGGGGGAGGGGGGGGGGGVLPPTFPMDDVANIVVPFLTVLLCLVFGLVLVALVVRYVSETALIHLVNRHEETNEQESLSAGFRLGWSRPALRVFLIDLLAGLVGFVGFLLLILIAAAPLLLWLVDNDIARAIGTAFAIGLGLLAILVAILFVIAYSVVVPFIRRAAVLEGHGVMDAIRRGIEIVRRRPGDALVMAVLLFALGLAVSFVLIPLFIILALVGLVLGGLPGLLIGGLVSLFAEGAVPWVIGGLVALPIILLVVFLPMIFLGGLWETYKSTTWTLTFRELVALETLTGQQPAVET